MGLFISNLPNPVKVIRLDCINDASRQKWTGCIVDASLGAPTAYVCFRGDIKGSARGVDRLINGRRDIWFRIPIKLYIRIVTYISRSSVDPYRMRGLIFKDLVIGPYLGRFTNPPSWSQDLIATIKF